MKSNKEGANMFSPRRDTSETSILQNELSERALTVLAKIAPLFQCTSPTMQNASMMIASGISLKVVLRAAILILHFYYILLIRSLFIGCLNRHYVLSEYYYNVYVIFRRTMSAISGTEYIKTLNISAG